MDECLHGWNRTPLNRLPPYQSGGITRRARIQKPTVSRRQKPTRRSDHDAEHGHEHDDGGIPHQGYDGNHHHDHARGRETTGNPSNPTQDPAADTATLRNLPLHWIGFAAIHTGGRAIAYFATTNVRRHSREFASRLASFQACCRPTDCEPTRWQPFTRNPKQVEILCPDISGPGVERDFAVATHRLLMQAHTEIQ